MFYKKNLPGWERLMRVAAGIGMVTYAVMALPAGMAEYAVVAMGGIAIMTGFIGFCPICAMAGRRLDKKS